MRRFSWNVVLALALVVLLGVSTVTPQGTSPPQSLRVPVPDLYFGAQGDSPDGSLAPTAANNSTACGQYLDGADARSVTTFETPGDLANGTYWIEGSQAVRLDLFFMAPPAPADGVPGAFTTAGFAISAQLKFGTKNIGPPATAGVSGPIASPPGATPLNFAIPENGTESTGALVVEVTLTPSPGPQNVAIACGSTASKFAEFGVVRGVPGDGDLDGDGDPDSTDPNRDGGVDDVDDAFDNAVEEAIQCGVHNFADDPDLQPGDHDGDGDGYTDEEECAAGSDPTLQASVPPPPAEFPWGLIILGVIILALIAGIVFFFLVFGKAVKIGVVSEPELLIPPGNEGKYQLQVSSLRKKGNPINFQLSAAGMPEGWDAKLSHDHVVLDPVGGAKNAETVWLTVHAPEHTDPESAVVTAKAIALNAAGRKDTFKLPAKARTITSINVPPGAKVPVKRGAAVKMMTDKETKKAAEAPASSAGRAPPHVAATWQEPDRPVIDIEGVGETYAKKLEKMGVSTVHQLYDADPAAVGKKTGAAPATVQSWLSMSELIDVKGVGPQYAELLVRAGVMSIAELAESDPKELAAKVESVQEGRAVRIQGGPAGVKTCKNWVAAAKKHPMSKPPEPSPEDEAKPAPAAAPAPAAPPNRPTVQVGGLAHSPATFRQGQEVKSSVTVTNTGGALQKLKLSLFVNDALADAHTIDLKPGKAKEIKFKWVAQERNKLNIRGELVSA